MVLACISHFVFCHVSSEVDSANEYGFRKSTPDLPHGLENFAEWTLKKGYLARPGGVESHLGLDSGAGVCSKKWQ